MISSRKSRQREGEHLLIIYSIIFILCRVMLCSAYKRSSTGKLSTKGSCGCECERFSYPLTKVELWSTQLDRSKVLQDVCHNGYEWLRIQNIPRFRIQQVPNYILSYFVYRISAIASRTSHLQRRGHDRKSRRSSTSFLIF